MSGNQILKEGWEGTISNPSHIPGQKIHNKNRDEKTNAPNAPRGYSPLYPWAQCIHLMSQVMESHPGKWCHSGAPSAVQRVHELYITISLGEETSFTPLSGGTVSASGHTCISLEFTRWAECGGRTWV